ncbi:hypothetical protein [Streptomyces sp. TLI_171]|uniref:hypothetical protein n=1 Tax=Streptomyces sp. TLI_171 TaxID=1938859 RepID=UPI000C1752A8|nr:hypothetical protein [Streptomyces sp. TLI_171]RKE20068.1 hypothetical protein BX266_3412 [Streptomyces sp. TLI_171]
MLSRTGIAVAVAAGVVVLAATNGTAAATASVQPPQAVTGPTLRGGADGLPHELLCPPDESIYSGGFTVSPGENRILDRLATDVLENRPNEDATGWIVAVRRDDCPPEGARGGSRHADLTIHLVCTDGQNNTSLGG